MRHLAVTREDAIAVNANAFRGINQTELDREPIKAGEPTEFLFIGAARDLAEFLIEIREVWFCD